MAERQPLANINPNVSLSNIAMAEPDKPRYIMTHGPIQSPHESSAISGLKRAREDDEEGDDDEYDLDDQILDKHCDQVRRQINTFIDNGGMKVCEFIQKIGVSSGSYYMFMKQHGKDKGMNSSVYISAFIFFKRRELKNIPMPKKQKTVKATDADKAKSSASSPSLTYKAKKPASRIAQDVDKIADIHLDGEKNDTVSIFDSCDEIRRKIGVYMRYDGVTQAEFVRTLKSQFSNADEKVTTAKLTRFRGNKGSEKGCSSPIFYSGYVFFEKLRLADKKPKTQHRLGMEDHWDGRGMIRIENTAGYLTFGNERPIDTPFGVKFVGRR